MSKRWNYKVLEMKVTWRGLSTEAMEAVLAQWGQQGWELTSTVWTGAVLKMFLKKEA